MGLRIIGALYYWGSVLLGFNCIPLQYNFNFVFTVDNSFTTFTTEDMGEMSAGELKEDILLDTPSYISMERKDSGVQVLFI